MIRAASFKSACFFSKTVRLGEWNTLTEKDCVWDEDEEEETCTGPVQDIDVKSFIPHPDYSRQTIHNDIGLVQLSQAAKLGQKNIKPICLPFAADALIMPNDFLVIGWGRTQNSSGSTVLQKASLKIYGQQQCEEKFSKRQLVLSDGQFCAGGMGEQTMTSRKSQCFLMNEPFRQGRRL